VKSQKRSPASVDEKSLLTGNCNWVVSETRNAMTAKRESAVRNVLCVTLTIIEG